MTRNHPLGLGGVRRGPYSATPPRASARGGVVLGAVLAWMAATQPAFAQAAADPAGSSAINGALLWIQGTLLGNLATTAAVIAIAVVGLLMLTGRMDWKRGLTVIVGAFILFGATTIVAGIRSAATLQS